MQLSIPGEKPGRVLATDERMNSDGSSKRGDSLEDDAFLKCIFRMQRFANSPDRPSAYPCSSAHPWLKMIPPREAELRGARTRVRPLLDFVGDDRIPADIRIRAVG